MTENGEQTMLSPCDVETCKEKAGVVLIGERQSKTHPEHNEMCIVAPWLEGAFDDERTKAYLLPRGSVDDNEVDQASAEIGDEGGYLGRDGMNAILHAMQLEPQEIVEAFRKYRRDPEYRDKDLERVNRFFGAIRETYEETGINLTRVPGFPGAENHPLGAYEGGISLATKIDPTQPLDVQLQVSHEVVPSSRTNPHLQTLFMVKVDGIEQLMGHVKGTLQKYDAEQTALPDGSGARERASLNTKLPNFEQLMQILRSGMAPVDVRDLQKPQWLEDKTIRKKAIFAPSFDAVERDWVMREASKEVANTIVKFGAESAQAREATIRLGNLAQNTDYDISENEFDEYYAQELAEDKQGVSQGYANRLKEDVATIKSYLKAQEYLKDEMGDAVGLKLNTKNRPLRWTQEGADLITIDAYAQRVAEFAQKDVAYRDMMSEYVVNDRQNGYHNTHKSTLQIIGELCTTALQQSEYFQKEFTDEQGTPNPVIIAKGARALKNVQRQVGDPAAEQTFAAAMRRRDEGHGAGEINR